MSGKLELETIEEFNTDAIKILNIWLNKRKIREVFSHLK